MEVNIVLSCEEGSAQFSDRSFTLADGGQVEVARADVQDHPQEDNAVFECKVLSRAHAVIRFVNGQVLLKDTGSRNGTFVNSFRLSKSLQESEETRMYSQDLIRFGAQVKDNFKCIKEKCIFAKLRIVSPSGEEHGPRPQDHKLRKLSPDVHRKEAKKEEESSGNGDIIHDRENLEDRVHSLERTLSIVQEREDKIVIEMSGLKRSLEIKEEQSRQLTEDLEIKSGGQQEKVSELQNKMDEREKMLERKLKENDQLQKELDDRNECIHKKNMDIDNLTNTVNEIQNENTIRIDRYSSLEAEMENHTEEINYQKNEVIKLQKLLFEAEDSVKGKEREMLKLTEILNKDATEIKVKDDAYQELESIVSEEDNTLQQAEKEMKRLLSIVAEDQNTILSKDRIILKLQKSVKEKDDFINKECNGISKQDMETRFAKNIDDKNKEILILKNEMQLIENSNVEKEIKIHKLKDEMENKVQNVKKYDELKMKSEELMTIITKQQSDIETFKNKNVAIEVGLNINEILQKEAIDLKLTIQEQDQDIKSLNSEYSGLIEENQQMIKNLQQKVINEQQINEQSEEEIIQLRIELDNIKKEMETITGRQDLSKDEEILNLKSEILKEEEITTNVQVAQEKEIMEKEKEISDLNRILEQERKKLEKFQAGLIGKSSLSETLLNDESVTLLEDDTETLTMQEVFDVDEDDDFSLIEDLEIDEDCMASNLNNMSLLKKLD